MSRFMELDPTKAKTYQARERPSLVTAAIEGKAYRHGMSVGEFFLGLPNVLKAKDLLEVAAAIAQAKKNGRAVIAMFGGHVVKCGCVPLLLDLAKDGFVTHFASNGAAAIHDTELALCGHTSEDVAAQIEDGSFGMAADTADALNHAASRAHLRKEGFGEALGALLAEKQAPYDRLCLSVQAARLNIPYTVHVALGTDIVHQHPSAVGADIGDASLRDFRIFAASVSRLEGDHARSFSQGTFSRQKFRLQDQKLYLGQYGHDPALSSPHERRYPSGAKFRERVRHHRASRDHDSAAWRRRQGV